MPIVGMVTLAAERWGEMVTFYNELLGLDLLQSDERNKRARLRAGPGLVLEIHAGGWGSEKRKTTRLNPVSLCLRVNNLPDTVRDLEHQGVSLLGEVAGGVEAVLDPEGNRIYLYFTDDLPRVPDGWELEGEQQV